MPSSKNLYKLPQGTERLLLGEALRRQQIVRRVQDIFSLWGYQPVQTPVIDFFDLYKPFLDSDQDQVYRLVDREGALLMLRSDITLFLARSVGATWQADQEPARLCYADTILRPQHAEDISENEFFQIGAEFIGSKAPEGDLEILLLLDEILSTLGLDQAKIHMGSRKVFDVFTEGWSEAEKHELQTAVLYRRAYQGTRPAGDVLKLLGVIGTPSEAHAAVADLVLPQAIRQLAERHIEMAQKLVELGLSDRLRVDFSEIGQWSYYTGLVFQAYFPNVGDAIATGGRYDQLLAQFGLGSPSVGFSLSLRKIEAFVQPLSQAQAPMVAQGESFTQRLNWARQKRQEGVPVILQGVRP